MEGEWRDGGGGTPLRKRVTAGTTFGTDGDARDIEYQPWKRGGRGAFARARVTTVVRRAPAATAAAAKMKAVGVTAATAAARTPAARAACVRAEVSALMAALNPDKRADYRWFLQHDNVTWRAQRAALIEL